LPVDSRSLSQLRRYNPEVSVGLADILHKCMAIDPRHRYTDAGALTADLERHLHHERLCGVRNRSRRELWSKWRRRRPLALARVGIGAVLFVIMGMLAAYGYASVHKARQALAEGRKHRDQGE